MTDQEAQIKILFAAVNTLVGELAALTAYVADTGSQIVDVNRIRSIQGIAQTRAKKVGNFADIQPPALRASQMVEEIDALVQEAAKARDK